MKGTGTLSDKVKNSQTKRIKKRHDNQITVEMRK